MSSLPSAADIAADARWLTQALDAEAGQVRLIAMDRAAYRAASFLDDRMLQTPNQAHLVPWADVAGALPAEARNDARWIFHIGHVGSTLVSRLLGELPGVLAVREPRILRDVVLCSADRRKRYIAALPRLLSRSFAADEIALVKATSFVSEIAAELVPAGGRAVFLFATPANYIGTILAGENSVKEMAVLADSRRERMAGRVPEMLPFNPSQAHLAAAAWACEITALEQAAERMASASIHWADFDALLGEPEAALADIADLFGFEASPDTLAAIVRGPLMTRYSKALEYEYSPALRRDLIDQATALNKRDVGDALAMLDRAAQDSPLLSRALDRSQAEH